MINLGTPINMVGNKPAEPFLIGRLDRVNEYRKLYIDNVQTIRIHINPQLSMIYDKYYVYAERLDRFTHRHLYTNRKRTLIGIIKELYGLITAYIRYRWK